MGKVYFCEAVEQQGVHFCAQSCRDPGTRRQESPNHPNGQQKKKKTNTQEGAGDFVAEQGGAACATDQTTGESGDQVDHPPTGVDPVPKVIAEGKQVSLENLPGVTVRTSPIKRQHQRRMWKRRCRLSLMCFRERRVPPQHQASERRSSVFSPTQCDWLELVFAASKLQEPPNNGWRHIVLAEGRKLKAKLAC